MGIAAGLCTDLVMTREGRLGLNGPEVIEQEAGVEELDSRDRALVWSIIGGEQRTAPALPTNWSTTTRRRWPTRSATCSRPGGRAARSAQVDEALAVLGSIDPAQPPLPTICATS